MPPSDSTPLGDQMVHRLPGPRFPQPKPGQESGPPQRNEQQADAAAAVADIASRPELPDHPEPMAADIEDEEADPVVDSGPGIADGVKSLDRQRG